MSVRYNEATVNRPEGTRVVEGPFVFSDLVKISKQLRKEKSFDENDLNGITIFKSHGHTTTLTVMKSDTELPHQTVAGTVTILVLDGKLLVKTGSGEYTLGCGQAIGIQAGSEYALAADKETIFLQVLSIDKP